MISIVIVDVTKLCETNSVMPKELQTLPRQQDPLLTHDLFVTIGLIFVELIRLYIYIKSAGFITNPISSRSKDRYKTSNSLEFRDVIKDRREYRITVRDILACWANT